MPISAVRAENRIVVSALGDSTTAGTPYFLSPVEAPPSGSGDASAPYTHWIAEGRPEWKVFNFGIAAQRSDQIAERLSDALAPGPDYLIVLAGVNDVYQEFRSADDVKKTLERIYAGAGKARIVACTMLPYKGLSARDYAKYRQINDWIRRNASKRGYVFCDTASLVADPAAPERLAATPDGYHPDRAGYRRIGEALADAIEKDLSTRK